MDLIYADENRNDQGVLMDYALDLAFGADENSFELSVSTSNHCCREGYMIYAENTEYGGFVDKIRVETDTNHIVYGGRTWHGVLESKIIEPNAGEDYLIVDGEANGIIGDLIDRLKLGDLFRVSADYSNVMVKNYKFNRYTSAYKGIRKMLSTVGAKLKFMFVDGNVILSVVPITDYSKDDEFDSDQIKFIIEKNYRPVNHLICLGQGDLKDRQVIHLYADTDGNISKVQTQFGLNEVTETYDYSNAESVEELENKGREYLKEVMEDGKLEINLEETQEYDIDDIVGARELVTGITMSKPIIKKIVTINKNKIKIEHKVGEL